MLRVVARAARTWSLRNHGGRGAAPAAALSRAYATDLDEHKTVVRLTNVAKTLPTGRTLFQDVSLEFLYGAKIGILGLNGAGARRAARADRRPPPAVRRHRAPPTPPPRAQARARS